MEQVKNLKHLTFENRESIIFSLLGEYSFSLGLLLFIFSVGTSVLKTGPKAEPELFWVTVQYGSTGSNLIQYFGLIYF